MIERRHRKYYRNKTRMIQRTGERERERERILQLISACELTKQGGNSRQFPVLHRSPSRQPLPIFCKHSKIAYSSLTKSFHSSLEFDFPFLFLFCFLFGFRSLKNAFSTAEVFQGGFVSLLFIIVGKNILCYSLCAVRLIDKESFSVPSFFFFFFFFAFARPLDSSW